MVQQERRVWLGRRGRDDLLLGLQDKVMILQRRRRVEDIRMQTDHAADTWRWSLYLFKQEI